MKLSNKIAINKKTNSFTYTEEAIFNQLEKIINKELKDEKETYEILKELVHLNKKNEFKEQKIEQIVDLIFKSNFNTPVNPLEQSLFHASYDLVNSINGIYFVDFYLGLYYYLTENKIDNLSEPFFIDLIVSILKNPSFQKIEEKKQWLMLKYIFTGILKWLVTNKKDYSQQVGFIDLSEINADLDYSKKIKLNITNIFNIIDNIRLKINLSSDIQKAIISSFIVISKHYDSNIFLNMTRQEHDKLLEIAYKNGIKLDDFSYLLNTFFDYNFDNETSWKNYFSLLQPFLKNGDIRFILSFIKKENKSEWYSYSFIKNEKYNSLPFVPNWYLLNILKPFYYKGYTFFNEDVFVDYLINLFGNKEIFEDLFQENGHAIPLSWILKTVISNDYKSFLYLSEKNIDKILLSLLEYIKEKKNIDYLHSPEYYYSLIKTFLTIKEQKKSWLSSKNDNLSIDNINLIYNNAFVERLKIIEWMDIKYFPISFDTVLEIYQNKLSDFNIVIDNLILTNKIYFNASYKTEEILRKILLNNENKDEIKEILKKLMNYYEKFNNEDRKKVESFIRETKKVIG